VTAVDHVKLVRNRPDLKFDGRIHEQLLLAIRRAGGEVQWTDIFVIHSGADRSPEGLRRKRERDLRLLQLELSERPEHPFTLFNLGMTYADIGDHASAIHHLHRCLKASEPQESHVRKAYALLVGSFSEAGEHEAALRACGEGLALFPRDKELLFRKGLTAHKLGRLDDAVEAYASVLASDEPQHFSSMDKGIASFKTRFNLAAVLAEKGELAAAEGHLRTVVQEVPHFRSAWRSLLDVVLKQDRIDEAALMAERLLDTPSVRIEGLISRAEIARARNRIADAADHFRSALAEYPNDETALRAWCFFAFHHGSPHDAEQSHRRLLEIKPLDAAAHHNLGTIYLRNNEFDKAVGAFRESLRLRPSSRATTEQLKYALERLNRSVKRQEHPSASGEVIA
jgi:tetratricopeptide (TPR) repeat protein